MMTKYIYNIRITVSVVSELVHLQEEIIACPKIPFTPENPTINTRKKSTSIVATLIVQRPLQVANWRRSRRFQGGQPKNAVLNSLGA